ncbi:MAG: ribosome recycling factor [Planctomycetota bacterium]
MQSREEILSETKSKMDAAVEYLQEAFRAVRSGRATTGLVENIRVDYYGNPTPISQMANISVPEPRQIVVKPFDQSIVKEVEKAILKSDLGLTPQSDGKIIRLTVPMLSEEQRKKQVGKVKEEAENTRVALRNIRRDINKQAESLQKDSVLTEDDLHKVRDEIQDCLKSHEKTVDDIVSKKTNEIMAI